MNKITKKFGASFSPQHSIINDSYTVTFIVGFTEKLKNMS